MKQFNLEEYFKNPSKKIVTRDGMPVRIICTDRKDLDAPIVALVDYGTTEGERVLYYTKEGKVYTDDSLVSNADLFFATKKHEGWVNIYPGPITRVVIYKSEEVAKDCANKEVIATIKIEWEE